MHPVWLDALPFTGADQASFCTTSFLLYTETNADRGDDKYKDTWDSQVYLDYESDQEARHPSDQTEKRDVVLDY
jgi:hypothetical protein